MMRLALPKGRNLETALSAFRAAGVSMDGLEKGDRRLQIPLPGDQLEILMLKDWDVPVYVEHGIADCGVVGTDVLREVGGDLLVPVHFKEGRSRLSLIGRGTSLPEPGSQIRIATKFPRTAQQALDQRPWGVEIFKLSGSIELAPLLDLAELAIDIVQTGRTLRDNHLNELEVLHEIAPCLIVNRAAYQEHRQELQQLIERFEAAGVVE